MLTIDYLQDRKISDMLIKKIPLNHSRSLLDRHQVQPFIVDTSELPIITDNVGVGGLVGGSGGAVGGLMGDSGAAGGINVDT